MGFNLGSLFGGGDTIKGVIEGAGSLATDIREAVTGEGVELKKEELVGKANELETTLMTAVQQVNLAEATQGNWFQRSWRPGLAWIIISVIGAQYLLYPVLTWLAVWAGWNMPPAPALEASDLWPIILGLIGYRSFEKATNANNPQA